MKDRSPPVTASLGFGIGGKASPHKEPSAPLATQRRKARILVVHTDPALRRLMLLRLGAANYEVESVDGSGSAVDVCAVFRPNLVITDLRMEPMDGLALLAALKNRWPEVSVIILTAHGTIPEAVRATQCGAFGFLVKPIEKSELLGQVERAIAASAFTHDETDWRADIVSRSLLMEDRLVQANRAARTDVPVLLSGENGTGKELFARAIHAASRRREKPFVVVKCRNTDERILEEELFGSEQDTGETSAGGGSFQAASGGTLLLEDIDDLPFRLQVRLVVALRADRDIAGCSANSARRDVRLICSTSADLKQLVAAGQFHVDLYYRVSVLSIEVPPLGRRREDIPLLVSHFLEGAAEEGGIGKIYSPKAVQLLVTADWPGNVRQLFDLVKQNVALSQTRVMTEEFVKRSLGNAAPRVPSYNDARDEFARDYLDRNLRSTSGNVSQSARLAKRNRTDFYKLLSRYRLQPDEYKKDREPGPAGL
jgi:two-component system, NtrC family, response regulator GlrR